MPTYNANIPQPGDQLSVSQNDILQNFQTIGSNLFTGTNIGMPAISAPATLTNIIQMYAATSTLTSQPEFVIKRQTGSTSPVTTAEFTSAGYESAGYVRFPSGILIKWEQAPSRASGTYSFPTTTPSSKPIPAFSNPNGFLGMIINATSGGSDPNAYVYFSGGTFNTYSIVVVTRTNTTPISNSYFYIAIGY